VLKKELLELCLLHLLTGADRYGYELLQPLYEAFPDTQESAVYALLRGLCKAGCTEYYRGSVSGGPARKYYRITEAGRARHAGLLAQWRLLRKALADLGVE